MLTYKKAQELMRTARDPYRGKPLCNNTRLFERGENYAVQLYSTDVVTITPKTYILAAGGWRTVTTQDRMRRYAPRTPFNHRGRWCISDYRGLWKFYDGIELSANGDVIGDRPWMTHEERNRRCTAMREAIHRAEKACSVGDWMTLEKTLAGFRGPRARFYYARSHDFGMQTDGHVLHIWKILKGELVQKLEVELSRGGECTEFYQQNPLWRAKVYRALWPLVEEQVALRALS